MSTMKEVAKEAGVSVITVSRVINTPEIVKEETRLKVEKVLERLKYQSNQAAKALVANRTRVIHIFIPQKIQMSNPFAMHLIAGISDTLSKKNYSFLVRREWDSPYKCDGVIAMGISTDEEQTMQERLGVPVVLFGHSEMDIDWIDVDNHYGAYAMTNHLISLGHKDIGIIVINENRRFVFDRLNGYKHALEKSGIPVRSDLITFADNDENDGYSKALELLKDNTFTALFCTSDEIALGAVRASRLFKRNIPHDLSVAGFDGLGYELLTQPKITTVKQPVYEVGMELADVLIKRVEHKHLPFIQKMLKPTIIENSSVFGKE